MAVETVDEVKHDISELAVKLVERREFYSLAALLKALREQALYIEAVLKE